MPEGRRHPAFDGRCRIFALGKGGLSNGAIARRPGRGPPTVSRGLRRSGGGRGYRRRRAQGKATGRRGGAPSVPGKLTGERRSPERIPGRLRPEDPGMVGRRRIYGRVQADGKGGGTPLTHLRRRGRKPKRQGGRHAGRGHIPGRRDITERLETVGEKVRTGDRDADTVIGGAMAARWCRLRTGRRNGRLSGGFTERGRRWSERR